MFATFNVRRVQCSSRSTFPIPRSRMMKLRNGTPDARSSRQQNSPSRQKARAEARRSKRQKRSTEAGFNRSMALNCPAVQGRFCFDIFESWLCYIQDCLSTPRFMMKSENDTCAKKVANRLVRVSLTGWFGACIPSNAGHRGNVFPQISSHRNSVTHCPCEVDPNIWTTCGQFLDGGCWTFCLACPVYLSWRLAIKRLMPTLI